MASGSSVFRPANINTERKLGLSTGPTSAAKKRRGQFKRATGLAKKKNSF